jgi:hypothetical protein
MEHKFKKGDRVIGLESDGYHKAGDFGTIQSDEPGSSGKTTYVLWDGQKRPCYEVFSRLQLIENQLTYQIY